MKNYVSKTPDDFKKHIGRTLYTNKFQKEMKVIHTQTDSYKVEEPSTASLSMLLKEGDNNISNYDERFIQRIKQTSLLTEAEEAKYGLKLKAGIIAQNKLNQTNHTDISLRILTKLVQEGLIARNQMIESNQRLVLWIANRYKGCGLEFMDLIQEGILGLMKAVDAFDYEKGVRFSTYATWWITQSITRALSNQSRLIRIPEYLINELRKLNSIESKLTSQLSRKPSDEEIASAMEMPVEKIYHLKQIQTTPISLTTQVSEDDITIEDTIPSNEKAPDELDVESDNIIYLNDMLETLSEQEREIIYYRYGFHDGKKHKYQLIGDQLGITKQEASIIEKNALQKLKPLMIHMKGEIK